MPVNFTATRVRYRTLSWSSTAVNASMAVALDSSPASRGRMPGMPQQMSATVTVAHDRSGKTEPLELDLFVTPDGTLITWTDSDNAGPYNLIRGSLSQLRELGNRMDLGPVTCVAAATAELNTSGNEDQEIPPSGDMFFYLIESDQGDGSSYGTMSTSKPRIPQSGDCQ